MNRSLIRVHKDLIPMFFREGSNIAVEQGLGDTAVLTDILYNEDTGWFDFVFQSLDGPEGNFEVVINYRDLNATDESDTDT